MAAVRLSDEQFSKDAQIPNLITSQSLLPDYMIIWNTQKQDAQNKSEKKQHDFQEENPEVTSGDEETLIEDE